jgi:hypothetical protein
MDVFGAGATARRRNRATGAGVGSMKHAVGGNIVPRGIRSERLYLIAGKLAYARGCATSC